VKIKSGGSKRLTMAVEIPADMPPGDYQVIGEVLPYREGRPAAAPGAANDPNVHVPGIVMHVRRPDLVASVKSTFDGKGWPAGQAGKVTVTVANAGQVPAVGPATVVLYASPDGSMNGAVEVARVDAAAFKLKPGKGKAMKFSVRLPDGMTGASWRWLAVVNPDGMLAESDLANNSGIATGAFDVRAAA
jgi:hypothetical protein